ncbi:ComF family protein [Spongiimicrobium salis]|uniref:ComF family protein n=1 Tax=Spongiimicrobium salis TaxID=1667022 RepID=UPI00374CED72
MCTVCRNSLPLTEYNLIDECPIDRIFYGRIAIKKANSFLFFHENGIVKNLIHHLKYKNQEQIGTFLGDWYGSILAKNEDYSAIDLVFPVPLHKRKQRKRGYNQVSAFGKRIAHHLGATFREDVLIKTANTKTQTKKNRGFRSHADNALYMLPQPEQLRYKNVLLVDDVLTTGATLEACATPLKQVEGVSIYIITMAVVP